MFQHTAKSAMTYDIIRGGKFSKNGVIWGILVHIIAECLSYCRPKCFRILYNLAKLCTEPRWTLLLVHSV